jgi:hypothetical protein
MNIDAMFTDWPAITLFDVKASSPGAHDHIPPDPTSDADLSAKVGSIYDASAVYFRANVKDDVIKTDSMLFYDDDTFSLQWDALPLSPDGYGPEDRRYYFRADDHGRDEFKMLDAQNDGITFKVKKVTGGYDVELKIPWTLFGYTSAPPVGTRVKLGIQLTDDDGNAGGFAESWLAWYRGPSSCANCCLGTNPDPNHKDVWCDPTILGSLVVMP